MDRSRMIDRKHEVIAEAARLRRQVDAARRDLPTRRARRRLARLERRIDQLMAEQYRLRQAIDRAP